MLNTLSSLSPFLMAIGLGFPLLLKKLWGRGWSVAMQVAEVSIFYASFAVRYDSLLCIFSSLPETYFSLLGERECFPFPGIEIIYSNMLRYRKSYIQCGEERP